MKILSQQRVAGIIPQQAVFKNVQARTSINTSDAFKKTSFGKTDFPRQTIDGVTFDLGNLQTMAAAVINDAKNQDNGYVCFVNEQSMYHAWKEPAFKAKLNNALYTVLDGGGLEPYIDGFKCVHGPDFLPEMMRQLNNEQTTDQEGKPIKVLMIGETDKVQEKTKRAFANDFPDVVFETLKTPMINALSQEETSAFISQINEHKAHIILVALGCPKQERWMSQHQNDINGVQLGLGDAFAKYLGILPRPNEKDTSKLTRLRNKISENSMRIMRNGFRNTLKKRLEIRAWRQHIIKQTNT